MKSGASGTRGFRAKFNLPVKRFAVLMGVSESTVKRWEQERDTPFYLDGLNKEKLDALNAYLTEHRKVLIDPAITDEDIRRAAYSSKTEKSGD